MPSGTDDKEMLKLKTVSGRKRRSRNSFISSTSLGKGNIDLDQLFDEEKPMVYALVEVSKDSEKPAKKEKIPLDKRDLVLMIQKLMDSKKVKPDRKILRPSFKRKFGFDNSDDNSKILLKKENNICTPEQSKKSSGLLDLTVDDSSKSEGNRCHKQNLCDNMKKAYEENGLEDLKILFDRNLTKQDGSRDLQERINFITRGTNTDVVQTPKILEDVLQALNSNLGSVCNDQKSDENRSETKPFQNFLGGASEESERLAQSPQPNFLLVPFIINYKKTETCKKSNSCTSMGGEEVKRPDCALIDNVNPQNKEMIFAVRSNKSTSDLLKAAEPLNIHINSSHMIEIDCEMKRKFWCESQKEGDSPALEENKEPVVHGGHCFLKEVKTLQMKLNAIIKGLEMNDLLFRHHNGGVFTEKGNENGLKGTENSPKSLLLLDTKNNSSPDESLSTSMLLYRHPSRSQGGTTFSQDFCVQVALMKSISTKAVVKSSNSTSENALVIGKALMLDKLSQFPSEVKIGQPTKLMWNKTLGVSKSTPLLRTNLECRCAKAKRTSSLLLKGKINETMDYLKLTKLNLKLEGSRPDNGDMFEEEVRLLRYEKLKDQILKPATAPSKTTDGPFKKNITIQPEGDEQIITTVKPNGKIAKIKIVGNAAMGNESGESGKGKIKLELDDTSSIKISNKFTRKININVSNSKNSSSNNATNNSSSKINSSSRSSNNNFNSYAKNDLKDAENKKLNGNTKPDGSGKTVKKESQGVQKMKDLTKTAKPGGKKNLVNAPESETPQTSPKTSKLKKPSTPLRGAQKVKEKGSDTGKKLPTESPQNAEPETKEEAQPPEKAKIPEKTSSHHDKDLHVIHHSDTVEKEQNLTQPPPNDVKYSSSNESTKTMMRKITATASHCNKNILAPEQTSLIKPSQAVKSIWALTKVILYKDGSQSFEVLEASSSPPGYHLNQTETKSELQ